MDREVARDPAVGHRVLHEPVARTVLPPERDRREQDREAQAEAGGDHDREIEPRHRVEHPGAEVGIGHRPAGGRIDHVLHDRFGEEPPPLLGVEEVRLLLVRRLGQRQGRRPRSAQVGRDQLEVDVGIRRVVADEIPERQRLLRIARALLNRLVEPVGEARVRRLPARSSRCTSPTRCPGGHGRASSRSGRRRQRRMRRRSGRERKRGEPSRIAAAISRPLGPPARSAAIARTAMPSQTSTASPRRAGSAGPASGSAHPPAGASA